MTLISSLSIWFVMLSGSGGEVEVAVQLDPVLGVSRVSRLTEHEMAQSATSGDHRAASQGRMTQRK